MSLYQAMEWAFTQNHSETFSYIQDNRDKASKCPSETIQGISNWNL